MTTVRTVMIASLAAMLAACAVGPKYERPDVETGEGWIAPLEATGTDVGLASWWQSFDDPVLERLVDRALARNLDIRQAEARVAEARALRAVVAGGQYPAANVGASVSRQKLSENGLLPIGQIPGIERDNTFYEPRFDARWELDLFGRTRQAVAAADARVQAAEEQQRGVRLTVAAETARAYFALRGAQHVLEARRAAVAATRESARLVKVRFEAGADPEAAVVAADAQLSALEATLPALEAQERTAALSIGVLAGDLPESELGLAGETPDFVALAPIPVGERADILRRRPDVRAAERGLAAATNDLDAATAQLFPDIVFAGNAGYQSLETGNLFDTTSQIATLGLSISWHLFDGGRLRAQVHANEARVEQAALAYEKSVLAALTDAERAMARYSFGLEALGHQSAAMAAARRNYTFASDRYRAGDISQLELFDAERTLRNAEDAYARTHTQAATDLVALFKALGGGWDPETGEAG
jgi:NodT family efflux transporter outer membrane factor (OMF) lipoprotein